MQILIAILIALGLMTQPGQIDPNVVNDNAQEINDYFDNSSNLFAKQYGKAQVIEFHNLMDLYTEESPNTVGGSLGGNKNIGGN